MSITLKINKGRTSTRANKYLGVKIWTLVKTYRYNFIIYNHPFQVVLWYWIYLIYCEVIWVLIQTQKIIDLLEYELANQDIEYHNESTFQESRCKRKIYRMIISMIRDLENKGI
jgi:hypothetical protein